MKRAPAILLLALACHCGGLTPRVAAADASNAAAGAAVELPPMMVEESTSSVPWLYLHAGGIEFLSRCSTSTTRALAEAWLTRMQLVHALVPEEFLVRMDVPTVFVLYAQDLDLTMSAEIQRELQAGDERTARSDPSRSDRVNIAPSMRLSDRDMHASIAYIDETLFDAATLSISPNHVRYLIRSRVPELPLWLVDGVERMLRGADFVQEPITLRPLTWTNQGESDALASDPAHPRTLLPASELFATDVARAIESRHPRRVATREATQELFVRWAVVSGGATREALWKFATAAAERPVSETMFETLFGFDFSELRDRLSDYLPKAAGEFARIKPGNLPSLPPIEIDRATPNQIARVRGEWERLAIGHVQRRLPQVREPYIAQARRTLRRAFDAGDRDPRLLATMGLCEIDARNPAGARQYLEPAVAAGVVRPRAYYELARLRFDELRRDAKESKLFSFTALAPIIEPLRRSVTQSPPLVEAYALLAEAWASCELAPNTEEFTELTTGARLFARRPAVAFPVARVLTRHGRKAEATTLLETCHDQPLDDATRTGIERLRAELAGGSAEQR